MSAILSVNGNVFEIVEFARILKAGLDAERQGISPEIWEQIDAGSIIGAIKVRREQTGCGLKEAKDFVESCPDLMKRLQEAKRRNEEKLYGVSEKEGGE